MSVEVPATPHSESHLHLLPEATVEGMREVDAVVVPTARGADHLRHAAAVAAALGATLLALCNGRSRAVDVGPAVAEVADLVWFAVDVETEHTHPLLPPPRLAAGGRASLSVKRNLALLLARSVGWATLLFLDDDIRDVSPDLVRLAAGGLNTAVAVSLAVADFPDNSVACHANRLGGGQQTVFVGGAALLVDVRAPELGHFPTAYNEDWLFLFAALAARKVVREGRVAQLRYDPFARPGRAREEEFGDIVAEGLLAHLEAGGRDVPMAPWYWRRFLRRRDAFLRRTADRVAALPAQPRHRAALRALGEASGRCATTTPGEILAFLRQWQADDRAWRERLPTVPRATGVPDALCLLGLGRPECGGTGGLAVIVPGFLDGPASPAHRSLAARLRSTGTDAVVFEPGGVPSRPGAAFTHTPSDHLADLAALVDAHAVPGRRVMLVGHCYGAWLAGLLAARDPRVTDVVAIMPTRCFVWAEDYRPDRDTWRGRRELLLSYPEPGGRTLSAVRLPHTLVADAVRHDLPTALRRLRQRILFVAGTADEVVGIRAVERLHDECGARDNVLRLLPVQHDYRDDPVQIALVDDCVVEWLEKGEATASAATT